MNKSFILTLACACLLGACHTVKTVQQPVITTDTAVIAVVTPVPDHASHAREDSMVFIRKVYESVMDNKISFTTFSGKVEVDYEDAEGKKINVNAHVRMQKDSVIWVSITAMLGIEALRMRITKDSVRLLDKQNKVYTPRSISFLQELTALPLNLSTLQDLLLGNPVFLDSNIISYNRSGTTISLQSVGNLFRNFFTVAENGNFVQKSQLEDLDQLSKRTCFLSYDDYENKKNVNFSAKRIILVADKKKLNVKLDFKQYEFNEKLSFPFTVPKNYSMN